MLYTKQKEVGALQEADKQRFYQALKEMAAHIESFGLGCIVVDNPFRAENNKWGTTSHCFIITQPDLTEELNKKEFKERFRKAEDSCRERAKDSELFLFGLGPITLIDSLVTWFDFIEKSKKHPILSGDPLFGATDVFLSEVIYGHKLHQILVRAFQEKYGPNFIQNCYRVYIERCKEGQERLNALNARLLQEAKEREKPLNRYEKKEIKNFLLDCVETVRQIKATAIVGIDCSGRPLAKMLWQLLKKIGYSPLPSLQFLDPHQLRDAVVWQGPDELRVPDVFVRTFKIEFPHLFQLLYKEHEKVLFIDDQIFSYMNTTRSIHQLIEQVAGRKDIKFHLRVVSGFCGYNGLTWWKDKTLLRVRSNKNCQSTTLKALSRKINVKEEKKIADFEMQLSKIVLEVS